MKKKKRTALILSALLLIPIAGNISAKADRTDQKTEDEQEADPMSDLVVRDSSQNAAAGGSVVFFTSDISPEGLLDVYQALDWKPTGKTAVKISTGEPPASNYLRPALIADLVQFVKGTIVECNTAYGGSRAETDMHMQVAKDHGFTDIAEVDILDADGSMELSVSGGSRLSENLVGAHLKNYDSCIVLSHFKGHAMAGFGGAIKNISIGLASSEGKCLIHTGGKSHTNPWGASQTAFTESMAEAGKSVSDYLGNGKRIVYVNVLNNISIDCDCDGNPAKPDIHDIGILASTDPVAIDQASLDLCFAAQGSGSLKKRVSQLDGLHTLEHAQEIGLGNRKYELKDIAENPQEPETKPDSKPEQEPETKPDSSPGQEDPNPVSPSASETEAKRAMAGVKITNFKAKSPAKRTIRVSWKKVSKAEGYQIQISSAPGFKAGKILLKKFITKNSFGVSKGKLKSGKTYYVRTRAFAAYRKGGKTYRTYSRWSTGSGKVKVL